MKYARQRSKRDGNHNAIVDELEALGISVLDLSAVGSGCPDLLIGRAGRNYLVEIKPATGPKREQGIRKDRKGDQQRRFHEGWRGTVFVAHSTEEILKRIGAFVDHTALSSSASSGDASDQVRRLLRATP